MTDVDPVHAITWLVHRYAELIDLGDFDGIGDLFANAEITSATSLVKGRAPASVGRQQVIERYVNATRRYADGTPLTKHVTTNLLIEVEPDGRHAACRSYFTVLQAVPGVLDLQIIIAGRYHDRFEVREGSWTFASRHMIPDLIGNLQHHLLNLAEASE